MISQPPSGHRVLGWAVSDGINSPSRTRQQASAARQIEGLVAQLLHTANGATFALILWITRLSIPTCHTNDTTSREQLDIMEKGFLMDLFFCSSLYVYLLISESNIDAKGN